MAKVDQREDHAPLIAKNPFDRQAFLRVAAGIFVIADQVGDLAKHGFCDSGTMLIAAGLAYLQRLLGPIAGGRVIALSKDDARGNRFRL